MEGGVLCKQLHVSVKINNVEPPPHHATMTVGHPSLDPSTICRTLRVLVVYCFLVSWGYSCHGVSTLVRILRPLEQPTVRRSVNIIYV